MIVLSLFAPGETLGAAHTVGFQWLQHSGWFLPAVVVGAVHLLYSHAGSVTVQPDTNLMEGQEEKSNSAKVYF